MMKHLGKIIVFILFIPLFLAAKVELEAPTSYFQGDSLEFKIVASGKDVEIPTIKKIGDYVVQSLGTATQTNIFNGKQTTTLVKSFAFYPKGDITIPPIEVKVAGKVEKTKPQKVKMVKVEKTISDLYGFDIKVDKKELYVGEALQLQIEFRYRKDLKLAGLEFEQPDFGGFWVKKLKEQTPKDDPSYFYQSLHYLLFPQKGGKVNIGPFKINVVTSSSNYTNSFFYTGGTNSKPVYSNTIHLNVKPLPKDVNLIGKFQIEGKVDKQKVKAGEPVSYKLQIKGEGNIDDISELQLNIPDATIYDNPAQKEYRVENGVYKGEYHKVYSIVSSKSFTIPSVELRYFDKETQSVKTIKTKAYTVDVQQPQNNTKAVLQTAQKEQAVKTESIQTKVENRDIGILHWLFFILGVIITLLGVVALKVLQLKKVKKKEDTSLVVTVKKAKSSDELLKVIVNYINIDEDLDKIIYQLENKQDIKEFGKIKKEVVKIVKNMEISTF